MMILLGFLEPVQAFIASIPSCVIGGGTACVLYGFISSSGIKMLKQVDFNNQKSLIICSVVLSLGISGVALGGATFSLSGTALALVAGVVLNLILKEN
jgi:uracil permease